MKQYLLAVLGNHDRAALSEADTQRSYADVSALNKQIQDAGAWVFAGGLYPPEVATVVQVRGDEVVTTDGPFAETKEFLGGFWVIRAADLDVALDWARKAAVACGEVVEVRPFQEESE
jgi:hypothetical protein